MRVVVTGATGVLGSSAVRALLEHRHEVVGLVRSPQKQRLLEDLGATAVQARISDHPAMVRLCEGADAVVNLATSIPVGLAGARPGAWRMNDRLRTEGVRRVVAAAREAGVRRVVQESVSHLYADNGDGWVTEHSALDITPATEPSSVAEAQVQDYLCESRTGVVLRFGLVVGDDPLTRWQLRACRQGRPFGLGAPQGWLHPVHADDVGGAVLAALTAPSGVYNVGAEPVRRADYVQAYADVVGRERGGFVTGLMSRVAGTRMEPATRSLRVSSDRLTATTGWTPGRSRFGADWFEDVDLAASLR